MLDKAAVCRLLSAEGVDYSIIEHRAVFTVEEAEALCLPHPESGAKNLFLRDDKKRCYYLLTVRDRLPVDLRAIQRQIGSRRLSFASPEDLQRLLGLIPGAVTPLGLLNDTAHVVSFWLDSYFRDRLISVHPNDNTATVYMQGGELMALLTRHGTAAAFLATEDQG